MGNIALAMILFWLLSQGMVMCIALMGGHDSALHGAHPGHESQHHAGHEMQYRAGHEMHHHAGHDMGEMPAGAPADASMACCDSEQTTLSSWQSKLGFLLVCAVFALLLKATSRRSPVPRPAPPPDPSFRSIPILNCTFLY